MNSTPNVAGATTQFQKFNLLIQQYNTLPEFTNEELEEKKIFAQQAQNVIGYSWGWVIFWLFFGGLLFGFTIALIIAINNHSKRVTFFQLEFNRLNNIAYQRTNLNSYKQQNQMSSNKYSDEKINNVLKEIEVDTDKSNNKEKENKEAKEKELLSAREKVLESNSKK